jgi:hypothetical protein
MKIIAIRPASITPRSLARASSLPFVLEWKRKRTRLIISAIAPPTAVKVPPAGVDRTRMTAPPAKMMSTPTTTRVMAALKVILACLICSSRRTLVLSRVALNNAMVTSSAFSAGRCASSCSNLAAVEGPLALAVTRSKGNLAPRGLLGGDFSARKSELASVSGFSETSATVAPSALSEAVAGSGPHGSTVGGPHGSRASGIQDSAAGATAAALRPYCSNTPGAALARATAAPGEALKAAVSIGVGNVTTSKSLLG